jgi:hypothetical protein
MRTRAWQYEPLPPAAMPPPMIGSVISRPPVRSYLFS